MEQITLLDKKILDILQRDFPRSVCPYEDIAQKLGITEKEVLLRIKDLKEQGIIRRIGAVMESKKMGFTSTLCACRVAEERIEEAAQVINQEKGVTHNYIRDHHYNLWFTLTASSIDVLNEIITELDEKLEVKIISMPARKVYKIKVSFEMGGTDAI